MKASIDASSTGRPWAELLPYIPPFGNRQTKRLRALPHFLTHSFSRLVRHHRNAGATMIPAAIEYFVPPINKLPLGHKVGLTGKGAMNLQSAQGGFPSMYGLRNLRWSIVYWPLASLVLPIMQILTLHGFLRDMHDGLGQRRFRSMHNNKTCSDKRQKKTIWTCSRN